VSPPVSTPRPSRPAARATLGWRPPFSPQINHVMLQELLWPNEWRVLVSCVLLNLTTREQVDRVVWKLFDRYPTPESMADADENKLAYMIRSLGMQHRRSLVLIRMSREYVEGDWTTPIDLYGCGKYADDSWRILFLGQWRNVQPEDHALVRYREFLERINA